MKRSTLRYRSLGFLVVVSCAVAAVWMQRGRDEGAAEAAPPRVAAVSMRPLKIRDTAVTPVQALGPAAPCCIEGVDCGNNCQCGEIGWQAMRPIPWQTFAQGEYIGPARTPQVPEYRLRVDDQIDVVYRLMCKQTAQYELQVGDRVSVESFTDEKLNRDLLIQPDGTITLRLLGQVPAAGLTVPKLTKILDEKYKEYYKVPSITVTPLEVDTRLEDLRASVDNRAGRGGQGIIVTVTPEGTIQLPALGSIPVQGLTLDEAKREIDLRYAAEIPGIAVTPVLAERAPRYVYVLGEVALPGRYELVGPTTVMQSIALAGSWNIGANLRQIVVFRRGNDWRLMATLIDVKSALYGKRPCPADEIWLRDSDIVLVPKSPIQIANEVIDQVFTRGIYSVVPLSGINWEFATLSKLNSIGRGF